MRLVHSSPNSAIEHHLRNVLEAEGIECLLKNEFLRMASGEVPPSECWTELWVVNDEEFDRARGILEAPASREAVGESWTCPGCGETLEDQFRACWRCGRER